MGRGDYRLETKKLPEHYDDLTRSQSEIRKLFSTDAASVVHCTLPPKKTSLPTRNIGIVEIWYFITGQGEVWRKQEDADEGEEVRVSPGTSLIMPANVDFQFRSISEEPLTFLCVTMPPWPGEHANLEVEGNWQPS